MTNAPCKDCRNRQLGCHGKCELYQRYLEIHAQEKSIIKRFEDEASNMRGYREDKMRRLSK